VSLFTHTILLKLNVKQGSCEYQLLKSKERFNVNWRCFLQAVRKFITRKCKCHGPTETCPTRTCWDELANFGSTGEYLKRLYNKADHVTIRQDGSIMKANPEKASGKYRKDRLVFLESSPNYCIQNPDTGKSYVIFFGVFLCAVFHYSDFFVSQNKNVLRKVLKILLVSVARECFLMVREGGS